MTTMERLRDLANGDEIEVIEHVDGPVPYVVMQQRDARALMALVVACEALEEARESYLHGGATFATYTAAIRAQRTTLAAITDSPTEVPHD